MRYVIEVLTESKPDSSCEWVLLASHDWAQPAIAAAAYDAAKHRYRRVRMRRDDGHVIVDSAVTETNHQQDSGVRPI